MTSAYFYWSSFRWRYHMHAALLFWLLSFINSLQNHVWPIRSFNRDHLQLEIISHYHSWERELANFTFKLIEVVCFDNSNHFLLNLAINPCFKALNVNKTTVTFAFARRNQKVVLFIFLSKTNFTRALHSFSSLKNSIEFS